MIDQTVEITSELLISKGFKPDFTNDDVEYFKGKGVYDYEEYVMWHGKHHVRVMQGLCNSNNRWTIHVDNMVMDSVAMAEMTYTWQFDKLMEIIGENKLFNTK